jgi:hypothetical protein
MILSIKSGDGLIDIDRSDDIGSVVSGMGNRWPAIVVGWCMPVSDGFRNAANATE